MNQNNFVKIIDFGISRILKPDEISDTEFLGTINFEIPNSETKSNSTFSNDLIEFIKNPSLKIPETPKIKIPPSLPEQIPQKKSDRIKLFLSINGQLTENHSEHTIAGDFYITENFQNWQVATKGK